MQFNDLDDLPVCGNWPGCNCQADGKCDFPGRVDWGFVLHAAAVVVAIVLLLTAVAVGVGLMTSRACAHDALPTAAQPQGWRYPFSCCSGFDCRQVGDGEVKEGPQGYVVPSGEVVPMTDVRVKESPDGEFHWCSVAGAPDGRTICLFVPPRGY